MIRSEGRFDGTQPESAVDQRLPLGGKSHLAERVGFEPTGLASACFQDRTVQPLRHLSAGEDTNGPQAAGDPMRSVPTYGRNTSGTEIVPSGSW